MNALSKAALVGVLILLALSVHAMRADATRVRADCQVVSTKTITETRDRIVQRTAAGSIGRHEYRFITARTFRCDLDDTFKTTIRLGYWRPYQDSPPSPGPIPFP